MLSRCVGHQVGSAIAIQPAIGTLHIRAAAMHGGGRQRAQAPRRQPGGDRPAAQRRWAQLPRWASLEACRALNRCTRRVGLAPWRTRATQCHRPLSTAAPSLCHLVSCSSAATLAPGAPGLRPPAVASGRGCPCGQDCPCWTWRSAMSKQQRSAAQTCKAQAWQVSAQRGCRREPGAATGHIDHLRYTQQQLRDARYCCIVERIH